MSNQKWIDLAKAACKHADVSYQKMDIITTWEQTFSHSDNFRNNAVLRINDDRILKLYHNNAQRQSQVERAALQTFTDHPNFAAPRLIAQGILADGQLYTIMSALEGESLQDFWEIRDELTDDELLSIAQQIAHMTTALHQLPILHLATAEANVGGREAMIKQETEKRLAEIKANDELSEKQKVALRSFTLEEGLTFLNVPPVLTHSDFSWAHVFMKRQDNSVVVTGFIDWGEAMLGPAAWDVSFHWLWTFSQHKSTMREFLKLYYPDGTPERLARRLFAAHYYTYSMEEVWDYIDFDVTDDTDIVRYIIRQLFPLDVFGSPD